MGRDRLLQKPPHFTRIIVTSLIGGLSILLGWCLLMGEAKPVPISRFYLGSAELLKFADSFGSVDASNDTVEKVLHLALPSPELTSRSLIAFEENRSFVYAVLDLSTAEPASSLTATSRWTRRLIFLKPSTFVLDDEIGTRSSPLSAEWLFHSRTQPSIQGRFASLIEEDHELRCETLLPEQAISQVKHQQAEDELSARYVLQVTSKQPSQRIRFLHVLTIRRRGDKNLIARTALVPKGDELHVTIEAPQKTFRLVLPSAHDGAGEIEISRKNSQKLLDRRFFPSGVLPHGREGLRLLDLWDGSYRGGKRPFWDAGQPSGELRRVVEQGIVNPGPAVDLGCGSGTDAIYLASKGFDVTAIDIAPTALSLAREKAEQAGVKVRWLLANVLSLPRLEPFQFIFDRGCYHEVRFDNAVAYVETVRKLSQPGHTRFLLLAGNPNEAPIQYAPPQVAEEDIRSDFSPLFDFEWVRETRFETSNPAARGPLAWSVMLRRKVQR